MSFRKEWSSSYKEFNNQIMIQVGNKELISAVENRNIFTKAFNGTDCNAKYLFNILYFSSDVAVKKDESFK